MQSDQAMKDFVIKFLNENLSAHYYYHNCGHTLYVMEKAIEIAKQENCTEEETRLIATAALWHDTGCIKTYVGHEAVSCKFAQQYLPTFGFTADEIQIICGIIMATKLPQSPKNKLEEIVADADLEYLGTENAPEMAGRFFKELKCLNPTLTEKEWNLRQISFLEAHQYFTDYCKKNKNENKKAFLKNLKEITIDSVN